MTTDDATTPDTSQRVVALEVAHKQHAEDITALKVLRGQIVVVATLACLFGATAFVSAMTVRDTALASAARLSTAEAHIQAMEATARVRDAEDRSTRDAIVRLTTTVDALRVEVTDLRTAVLGRDPNPFAPQRR